MLETEKIFWLFGSWVFSKMGGRGEGGGEGGKGGGAGSRALP